MLMPRYGVCLHGTTTEKQIWSQMNQVCLHHFQPQCSFLVASSCALQLYKNQNNVTRHMFV